MINPLPQPLPIHLSLAMTSYLGATTMIELMSSSAESKISKSKLNKAKLEVEKAARNKLLDFFAGINSYATQPVSEWKPNAKVIWQEGSTRILDFGGKGQPILFIPPLINRANILDLSGEKSLMKFLSKQGNALLVDWGAPTESEINFNSDSYIQRLTRFCQTQKKLIIGGYCMGGLLALKLAKCIEPSALILLATPWNFHAPDVKRVEIPAKHMHKYLDDLETVPPEFIQSLFMMADPWRVYNKYSSMGKSSAPQKKSMMEIEYWVNNGVPMSVLMAKECIIDWTINNTPGKGKWLDVSDLQMPVFLGCPTNDKIVPIGCSIPLAGLLTNATLHKFNCGHIGMLTRKLCFEPIKEWLENL